MLFKWSLIIRMIKQSYDIVSIEKVSDIQDWLSVVVMLWVISSDSVVIYRIGFYLSFDEEKMLT